MKLFRKVLQRASTFSVAMCLGFMAQSAQAELICPGASVVLSCGNLACEKWTGEDAETCPSDCASYAAASYNFQQICDKSQELLIPSNEEELQKAMQSVIQSGRHVKIVGRLHSTNSIICNDGALISTQKLETIHGIETYNGVETVKVQAGVMMGDLTDWLHQHGKALGYTLMGFRGISVAGAIGTAAHGSSPKHPSVLPALVESIEVLGADGKRTEYNRLHSDEKTWKALNTHLGMLGVILNVRLRIRPQFALKTQIDFMDDDKLLQGNGGEELIKDCDFGQMVWFPGARQVMRTCGKELSLKEAKIDAGARASFVDFGLSDWLYPIAKTFVHGGSCNSGANCLFESIRVSDLKKNPPLKVRDGYKEQNVLAATGYSHKMMASDLNKHSIGFYQNDWAVALPISKLTDALNGMREKFDLHKLCLPFAGIFIRYGQAEPVSWLAHSVPGEGFEPNEVVAFLDMVVYNPVGLTNDQRLIHEEPQADIVKMLIDRYGARLHWGKNKDWALAYQTRQGLLSSNLQSFREVVQEFDPYGIFANPTGEILQMDWPRKGEKFHP